MSSFCKRKNSERNNDRYWHSFKLRVCRTCDRDLVVDYLYFLRPKIKMWSIKVTCSENIIVAVSNILVNFFKTLSVHINLAFVIKSIFCKPALRPHIEENS